MVQTRHYEETYSDEDVAHLCEVGGLNPEDKAKFRTELESIAAVYRWEAEKWENIPRTSDVRRELLALKKRISRLDEGLEGLSGEAAHVLKLAVYNNNSNDSVLRITNKLSEDTPSLTVPLADTNSSGTALLLDIPDFKHFLGGLERAADDAVSSLQKSHSGQLRDYGLRLWMINLMSLWRSTTDAPFTRDETSSGEPITPAARFCVAAFLHISPDYAVSRILWEMRHRIKNSRKATGEMVAKNQQ